jgi:predicted transcriptional regulator
MARKGYVRVRKTPDGNIYTAKTTQQQTSVGMLRDLVRRAFRGSTVAAVLSLLDEKELDAEELAYLKEMIDRKTKREAR